MTKTRLLVLCAMLASFLAAAVAVAKTYYLPDYQGNQMDKRISNSDNIAGDGDNTCAKYNPSWVTSISADMECDAVKPLPNLTCYKNCRCKNVVSVGTGEQCNTYCNGTQCVSKSCKPGVSVAAGETCTERCASNSNICTAKKCAATVSIGTGEQCTATCGGNCVAKSCKAGVSVAAGETCTERCASNSGTCTAKSCNATVSVGTGEQCNTYCGGNCVAKSCKGAVSVGTGEQCTQRCASNSGVCTAKSCKSTATINTGEYCTERCASNNSCTAKACKAAVSVGTGETCTERCYSNSNTCTAKSCNSAVSVNSSTEVCTQTCASNSSICTAKRNKTCSERGMKDCNGSCIATSECCGGCPTGQKCSNGTCVSAEKTCTQKLAENWLGSTIIYDESGGITDGSVFIMGAFEDYRPLNLSILNNKSGVTIDCSCSHGRRLEGVLERGDISTINCSYGDVTLRNSNFSAMSFSNGASSFHVDNSQMLLDLTDASDLQIGQLTVTGPDSVVSLGSDYPSPYISIDEIYLDNAYNSHFEMQTQGIGVWFNGISAYGWTEGYEGSNRVPFYFVISENSRMSGIAVNIGIYDGTTAGAGGSVDFTVDGDLKINYMTLQSGYGTINRYTQSFLNIYVGPYGNFETYGDIEPYLSVSGRGTFTLENYVGGNATLFGENITRSCTLKDSIMNGNPLPSGCY